MVHCLHIRGIEVLMGAIERMNEAESWTAACM